MTKTSNLAQGETTKEAIKETAIQLMNNYEQKLMGIKWLVEFNGGVVKTALSEII